MTDKQNKVRQCFKVFYTAKPEAAVREATATTGTKAIAVSRVPLLLLKLNLLLLRLLLRKLAAGWLSDVNKKHTFEDLQ